MRPGGSRAKGHSFERKVAADLREAMPGCDAKRGWQARGGGKEEADVEIPMVHVECKHGIKPNLRAAYEQAARDSNGRIPVAICKDNRRAPIVIIGYKDWLAMMGQLWELKWKSESSKKQESTSGLTSLGSCSTREDDSSPQSTSQSESTG